MILSGAMLLALSFGFSACGGQAPATPANVEAPIATEVFTEVPVASDQPVLEIAGPSQNLSLTMAELTEIPATES